MSSFAVYSYHGTTYQLSSPVQTCLIILSTLYSGVALSCSLCSTLGVFDLHCAARVLRLWRLSNCWRMRRLLIGLARFWRDTRAARVVDTSMPPPCLSMTGEGKRPDLRGSVPCFGTSFCSTRLRQFGLHSCQLFLREVFYR